MPGTIQGLFIKPASGQPMRPVASILFIAKKGIEGDNAFGRSRRQVLIVDQAILNKFDLQPGDLRENITLEGLDLRSVLTGSLLNLGQSTLLVQGECTPCSQMDDIRPGLQNALQSQRGILASVVKGGSVRIGDTVSISPPPS
jgi:MOSC domain-containing protein YiiM